MAAHPKCSPIMMMQQGVSITGDWKKTNRRWLWSFLLLATPSWTLQSVQFRPHVSMPGQVCIVCLCARGWQRRHANALHHPQRTTKDVFIPTPAHAEGQTSGEWVLLYIYIKKGNNTIVTITTEMSTVMLVPMLFYLCRWNEKRKIFMSWCLRDKHPTGMIFPVIKPVWFYFDHSYYSE